MTITCKVCHNEYGDWRTHCPVCSTHFLFDFAIEANAGVEIIRNPIVAAKGCVRVKQDLYSGKFRQA